MRRQKQASTGLFRQEDARKILSPDAPFQEREAYNAIRTNLLFSQRGEKCPVFAVTSPTANNGKTLNSVNLAVAYAQMGKKTLLIDADMRNPTVHKMFHLPGKNGLSEFLAGLQSEITPLETDREDLYILPAGAAPPNPAELLAGAQARRLIERVRNRFDCVFIDTPPVNIVTDATLLGTAVTGYILIVKAGSTVKAEVRTALNLLGQVDAVILGFILNNVTPQNSAYGAHYKYGYSHYANRTQREMRDEN
ncbi:MAG: CpsD/CapB family tyrosine-protein kinase [Clostridiales bacterium]|uniref:non-specific protein-tyrosine kinase n=1 Tax=Candidatus Scybalenecus merdavium TaxID=2840939 RepID=A0A9D1MTH6_9FIRM|nr:CpsD/CapB family tyrosine-protein kinase [Clostridiales bacterium]HIU68473.1 CpsD/CapB family tyrosine-protein kinase [Candidatus Scubalenecus merdavium]